MAPSKVLEKLPTPGGSGDEGDEGEEKQEGVGQGRGMPIQQSVHIGVPVETAWKLWNKYEDFPKFMHRIQSAEKTDPKHVRFTGKIWGVKRTWTAEITEKRTYEVVAWTSDSGLETSGVVTFHKAGPRLTHMEINL